jgi:cytochrome c6
MKRPVTLAFASGAFLIQTMSGCSREAGTLTPPELLERGGELFARNCSGCHPDGGNAVYPQKTLHRMDLAANGITTAAGIVAKMRNPDPGMRPFDKTSITDNDASAIAQYILVTFK